MKLSALASNWATSLLGTPARQCRPPMPYTGGSRCDFPATSGAPAAQLPSPYLGDLAEGVITPGAFSRSRGV
ncbi:hypothetical protein KCP69_19495 [Salmonella enterica subsp. enterica]|nr:hypothetical protein KCP69_19495 [Salmonella enterica subsp. enterica]